MNVIFKVNDEVKHSAAHVMAAAVLKLFPDAKVGIGPVTKDGFYYDFDLNKKLTPLDLNKIEGEINQIILQKLPFRQKVMNREEAMNFLLMRGQIYKAELVNSIDDSEISFFSVGDIFTDLCRGPHVDNTSLLGPIILTKVEDTYWNEDVRRPRLQRIYGMAFNTLEDYEKYKKLKIEEKVRDYLNIIEKEGYGKVLDKKESIYILSEDLSILFSKFDKITDTFLGSVADKNIMLQPFYPKWEEMQKDIFSIFKLKERSYKEMPITWQFKTFLEESPLGKNQESGQNLDIKGFVLFTTPANLLMENLINNVLTLISKLELSAMEAEIESDDLSDITFTQISGILQKKLISHNKVVTRDSRGVVIKLSLKDYFGNPWNICQIGISTSSELTYTSKSKNKEFPAVITFGISIGGILRYLLEKYYGKFPKEISPYQAIVIPINRKFIENATQIAEFLYNNGISVKTDLRASSLKKKIRDAEIKSIPVMIFVGEKEVASESVSLRYESTNIGLVALDHLIDNITGFLNK